MFKQIAAFDQLCLVTLSPRFTGNIRSVYFALLSINNSKFWAEIFEVDFTYAVDLSGVDKDTYRRAMDFLNTNGLFDSYHKGTNYYQKARVSLKVLYENSVSNAVGNAASSTVDGAVGNAVSGAHFNKTINNKTSKNKKHTGTFVPPTIDEVIDFFVEKGCSAELARAAFEHYDVAGWKDTNGNQVVNWKQKVLTNWIKNEKEKNSGQKEKGALPTAGRWDQKYYDSTAGDPEARRSYIAQMTTIDPTGKLLYNSVIGKHAWQTGEMSGASVVSMRPSPAAAESPLIANNIGKAT